MRRACSTTLSLFAVRSEVGAIWEAARGPCRSRNAQPGLALAAFEPLGS